MWSMDYLFEIYLEGDLVEPGVYHDWAADAVVRVFEDDALPAGICIHPCVCPLLEVDATEEDYADEVAPVGVYVS